MLTGLAHVLFEIGSGAFALPAVAVSEVLPLPQLSTPPGLPEAVAGFLDFGGAIVPVLHTGRLLDLDDSEPGLYAHLLLLHAEKPSLALLVDRVTAVRAVPPTDRRPIDDGQTFRGCVVGEIASLSGTAHLLSVERLVSEGERRKIAEFHAAEVRRRSILEISE